MSALLSSLGLTAEFVTAVDGRALSAELSAAATTRPRREQVYGTDMTDAEIACYLSHCRVYERMLAEGVEVALILEDDIDAVADLAAVVRGLASQRDPQWSVVRLQGSKRSVAEPRGERAYGAPVARVAGRTLCRLETNVLGGCAYLMRREAAEVMLDYGRRIFMPIDQALDRYWENGIVPFVVRPLPVWQHDGFGSAIGPRGREVFGRSAAPGQALKRTRRALDGVGKRAFRLALRRGWMGRGMAAPRPRAAPASAWRRASAWAKP